MYESEYDCLEEIKEALADAEKYKTSQTLLDREVLDIIHKYNEKYVEDEYDVLYADNQYEVDEKNAEIQELEDRIADLEEQLEGNND